jgi:hypothetical protein
MEKSKKEESNNEEKNKEKSKLSDISVINKIFENVSEGVEG